MRQKIGYGIWAGLLMVAVVLQSIDPNNAAAAFLVGIVLAAVGRDLVWYRAITKAWPFSEKITDWSKVEALANTPPANTACETPASPADR